MKKVRRWLERVLLLAGLTGVGIWAGAAITGAAYQSWADYVFERGIHGLPATVAGYLAEARRQISENVRGWFGFHEIPPLPVPLAPIPGAPLRRPRLAEGAVVGRLEIPRLHLRSIVREGTGESTLTLALGHISGTAFPGEDGNVGVAGHRDTLFRGLRAIGANDLIRFETTGGNYDYRVESIGIVKPEDVGVLSRGRYPELTLVTCYPFGYIGSAPDRFIVKARRVSPAIAVAETAVAEMKTPSPEPDLPATPPPRKPGARKVSFQVLQNHSRVLVPGVSFGLSRADARRQRVDAWMWIAPERRTIWLRNQPAHAPEVFYGHQDGRKREVVITSITSSSVSGYLLLPANALPD